MPLPRDRPRPYQIDVELEVPASLTGRDAPWDQLQSFTRLGGPAEIASSADVTIDALRRGAVTLTRMLTRAEHIKERGRSWLTGKMVRFQSQRALRCRAPARRLPRRDVVVEAREWCRQTTRSRPDPLHPEAGGVIASHADPIPASRHRAPAAGSLECRGADAPTESADPSRDTRPAGR